MKTKGVLRSCLLTLVVLSLLPWCMAFQQKPPGNSGGAGNTRGGNSNPSGAMTPGDSTRTQRSNPQAVFISGIVAQEDGGPLPTGVIIERVCGGKAKKEAYVAASGVFSFQIGGENNMPSMFADASDDSPGGLFGSRGPDGRSRMSGMSGPDPTGYLTLIGCELRAQIAGYRSSSIILTPSNLFGNIDVGTIVIQPMSRTPGTTVSLLDMRAPKEARKSVEHADKALHKNNLVEAEKDLKSALTAFPDYASAWFRLGLIYERQKQFQNAREAFTKAIAADDKFVNPYIRLAGLAGMEQKWQEVAEFTDRAIALDPLDFPEGYFFNALAYYVMDKLDVAEKSARKAQRLDPQHRYPTVNLVLADVLEKKHDISGSLEQLQAYLKFSPEAANADKVRSRIQKLKALSEAEASNLAASP